MTEHEQKIEYRGFNDTPYDPAFGILKDNTATKGMTYVELQAYFKSKGVVIHDNGPSK